MLRLIALVAFLGIVSSCTTFEGEYTDPEAKEIVDDRWNETDARLTSQNLVNSMLQKPWLTEFRSTHSGQKPVVIVKDIENRTDEHIDTKALNEAITNDLINSGTIRFVDAAARDKILQEITYQQESGMVAKDSAKKKGRQTGADFFLSGAISSQVHTQGGVKTVTYQTALTLTDLESSELSFSGKYDVKKKFKKSGSGF